MSTTILSSTLPFNSYTDMVGGHIANHSSTGFSYVSTTGFTFTVVGSSLTFDALGILTGGTLTGFGAQKDGINYGGTSYSGLAVDFSRLILGEVSGTPRLRTPDPDRFFEMVRAGNDQITNSDFGRNIFGYGGNDTISGGAGDDWVYGGSGKDSLFGGGGVDGISFFNGNAGHGVTLGFYNRKYGVVDDGFGFVDQFSGFEKMEGSQHSDKIQLNDNMHVLWGLNGNDRLEGSYFSDTIYGGDGKDTLQGDQYGDLLDGGAGVDTFYGGAYDMWTDTIAFWSADEIGHGAEIDQTLINGNILDDGFGNVETAQQIGVWYGSRWADHFTGNALADQFFGNDGDDVLIGGAGNDGLYGGAGNDRLYGGDGDDSFAAGSGKDRFAGGAGWDELGFWDVDGGKGVNVDLSLHTVLNDGYGNAESATGFENLVGSDFHDRLIGNDAYNRIWGNSGDDKLNGGNGDDTLYGGSGNDALAGGNGNDQLWGYENADTVTGGAGVDRFYLTDFAAETFTDMTHGTDKIGLFRYWVTDSEATALKSSQFYASTTMPTAHTTAQLILYNTTTGDLYYDQDGSNGTYAPVLMAHLDNHTTLTYSDFFLYI